MAIHLTGHQDLVTRRTLTHRVELSRELELSMLTRQISSNWQVETPGPSGRQLDPSAKIYQLQDSHDFHRSLKVQTRRK